MRKQRQSCRAALLRRLLHSWSSSSPSGGGPDSSLQFAFSFFLLFFWPGLVGYVLGWQAMCLVLWSCVSFV